MCAVPACVIHGPYQPQADTEETDVDWMRIGFESQDILAVNVCPVLTGTFAVLEAGVSVAVCTTGIACVAAAIGPAPGAIAAAAATGYGIRGAAEFDSKLFGEVVHRRVIHHPSPLAGGH